VIRTYISSFNRHSERTVIKDESVFILGYLNAVIYRSIALSTAWSHPERKKMAGFRDMIIHNALESINLIEKHYNVYYEQYKENYIQLSAALREYARSIPEKA